MRLLKFLAVVLTVQAIVTASSALAQSFPQCNALSISNRDTVRIRNFTGRPGDTVYMPIYVKTDSAVAGFQFIFKTDTVKLNPTQKVVGTSGAGPYYNFGHQLVGRLLSVQTTLDNQYPPPGTKVCFTSQFSFNPFDSGSMLAAFTPPLPDSLTSSSFVEMSQGSGVIAYVPFVASPTLQHGDTVRIRFHQVNQQYEDSSGILIEIGCRRSQIASAFHHGDTLTTNPVLYPTLISGLFTADTAPLPNIVAFTATPGTVVTGSSVILGWTVTNADSIVITAASSTVHKSTSLSGNTIVTPSATTTYTLTAYNTGGQVSATAPVTVNAPGGGGGGGGGVIVGSGNDGPEIHRDPDARVITIRQLETLQVRVTGSDQNGDTVKLKILNTLPANASFLGDSTNGTGAVERMFTFTPSESQVGSFEVIFSCYDYHGASTSNYLTVVVEPFEDVLYTTSDTSSGRRPVGGLNGRSQILLPINYAASHPSYGVQFDLAFDSTLLEVDSIVRTARTSAFTIYDNIGQLPGIVRVLAFSTAGDSILTDTIPILYAAFTVDSFSTPGLFDICLSNAVQSIDPDPDSFAVPLNSLCGVLQVDLMGDVNLDRSVNVADVVSTISVILSRHAFNTRQFAAGDVIEDAAIDVFDMVAILNLAVEPVPLPILSTAGQEIPGIDADLLLNYNDMEVGVSDTIYLDLDVPVDIAAMELDLLYDPAVMATGAPMLGTGSSALNIDYKNIGDGKIKVVISPRNITQTSRFVQRGHSQVLKIPVTAAEPIESGNTSQIRVSRALLATAGAEAVKVGRGVAPPVPDGFTLSQNYPNPFNPATNIEFTIDVDAGIGQKDVRLDIFNILGQRVKTLVNEPLSSGSYSRPWDATNEAGRKVATGLYLYRLQVGDASKTKKMIFLK